MVWIVLWNHEYIFPISIISQHRDAAGCCTLLLWGIVYPTKLIPWLLMALEYCCFRTSCIMGRTALRCMHHIKSQQCRLSFDIFVLCWNTMQLILGSTGLFYAIQCMIAQWWLSLNTLKYIEEIWIWYLHFINSSSPSAAYMHQWTGSALVLVMAWCRTGTKPLPEPMQTNCQLGTNFSEIQIKIQNFSFMTMHLKMSSGKWRPFCPRGDELYASIRKWHK